MQLQARELTTLNNHGYKLGMTIFTLPNFYENERLKCKSNMERISSSIVHPFYFPVVHIKTNIQRLGKEQWGNVDRVQINQKKQPPPKYISFPTFSITKSPTKLKYTVLQ